jgi:hypothetical protein
MTASTPARTLKSKILNPVSARYAVPVLLIVAVLSAAIYWFDLTQTAYLPELYREPLIDLNRLAGGVPERLRPLILAFVTLFALYLLGWKAAQRISTRSAWLIVIGGVVLFAVILLFMYPYDAADIFDNILHGRIISVYHANPFRDIPAQFAADPFYPYIGWRKSISAYGPGWEMLAGLSARLAGDGLIENVFVFKAVLVAFLAGCSGLIVLILRRIAPERALAGLVLFAWNPVVVYETIGQGHNDVAMLFWMLLAIWLLLKKRYTLTILALLIGALFKFIPLLFIPAAAAIALRNLGTSRARLRWLFVTTIVSVALVGLAYAPFWNGLATLSITRRTQQFTSSLPTVIYTLLQFNFDRVEAATWVSLIALTLTGLCALWAAWRAWRDRSELSLIRSMYYLIMFYLLLAVPWFHPWYAVWAIGLAALLPVGHAVRLAILFSFAVLSKLLIFAPYILWIARPPEVARFNEVLLGPSILALPWLYALYALVDTWRKRRLKPA